MSLNEWTDVLSRSFEDVLNGVISFVPTLIVAILVILLGWIVAVALAKVVEQVVKSIKLDKVLTSAGLDTVVAKTGFKLDSGAFLGSLVKWFTVVVFLITTFDILGLTQVNNFLSGVVVAYIPQVIAAVLILLIAVVIADALQRTVVASARAADLSAANFLGSITKWSIWIFAVLAALVQLGIGSIFIQTLFTGVVVALSIAFGLAFGLGGRDAAAQAIEKMKKEVTSHK